jgi:hypothetical protein
VFNPGGTENPERIVSSIVHHPQSYIVHHVYLGETGGEDGFAFVDGAADGSPVGRMVSPMGSGGP